MKLRGESGSMPSRGGGGMAGGTRPAAKIKKTVKATAKERGFEKDKKSRKEMKQQDIFYNKVGKQDLKEGNKSGAAIANTPKSNSKALKPKVPAKKKEAPRNAKKAGM